MNADLERPMPELIGIARATVEEAAVEVRSVEDSMRARSRDRAVSIYVESLSEHGDVDKVSRAFHVDSQAPDATERLEAHLAEQLRDKAL